MSLTPEIRARLPGKNNGRVLWDLIKEDVPEGMVSMLSDENDLISLRTPPVPDTSNASSFRPPTQEPLNKIKFQMDLFQFLSSRPIDNGKLVPDQKAWPHGHYPSTLTYQCRDPNCPFRLVYGFTKIVEDGKAGGIYDTNFSITQELPHTCQPISLEEEKDRDNEELAKRDAVTSTWVTHDEILSLKLSTALIFSHLLKQGMVPFDFMEEQEEKETITDQIFDELGLLLVPDRAFRGYLFYKNANFGPRRTTEKLGLNSLYHSWLFAKIDNAPSIIDRLFPPCLAVSDTDPFLIKSLKCLLGFIFALLMGASLTCCIMVGFCLLFVTVVVLAGPASMADAHSRISQEKNLIEQRRLHHREEGRSASINGYLHSYSEQPKLLLYFMKTLPSAFFLLVVIWIVVWAQSYYIIEFSYQVPMEMKSLKDDETVEDEPHIIGSLQSSAQQMNNKSKNLWISKRILVNTRPSTDSFPVWLDSTNAPFSGYPEFLLDTSLDEYQEKVANAQWRHGLFHSLFVAAVAAVILLPLHLVRKEWEATLATGIGIFLFDGLAYMLIGKLSIDRMKERFHRGNTSNSCGAFVDVMLRELLI